MYASSSPTLANNVNAGSAAGGISSIANMVPGIAGILSSIFGADAGGVNGASAGMDWMKKLPGYLQDALGQYNKIGQGAAGALGSGSSDMFFNPTGATNNDIQSFYKSPYYNQMIGDMTAGGNNAAAAGGTLGTGSNQADVANLIRNFASGQQQQYMDNVARNRALGEQGLYGLSGIGENAGSSIASGMTNYSSMMAQLAAAQGMAAGKRTGGIIGTGANLISGIL